MVKCTGAGCPIKNFDWCCVQCEEKESCSAVCPESINRDTVNCDYAIIDEEAGLTEFRSQQLQIIEQVTAVLKRKKQCEKEEKDLKEKLKQAMEKYGIKKFASDVLHITYVAPSTSTTVDTAQIKAKYPEIAAECCKISHKSSYIKIDFN